MQLNDTLNLDSESYSGSFPSPGAVLEDLKSFFSRTPATPSQQPELSDRQTGLLTEEGKMHDQLQGFRLNVSPYLVFNDGSPTADRAAMERATRLCGEFLDAHAACDSTHTPGTTCHFTDTIEHHCRQTSVTHAGLDEAVRAKLNQGALASRDTIIAMYNDRRPRQFMSEPS